MSLDAPRFGRVITAMVTPFDEGGALDLDSAANLAAWLVDNGSDGLVLAGTTGESPVLSDSEEVALTRAVRSAVKVPLLLGTGSNDTAYAVSATRRAEQLGVDGVLVVGPYYNRPSQAGLDHYFRSLSVGAVGVITFLGRPRRDRPQLRGVRDRRTRSCSLDCGLMFPDHDMLGVDIVLPDFTWLRERADDIEGCILTHGHEDHVGALSYLLPESQVPDHRPEFTLGLA
jgi:hypothetical protein